MTWVNFCGTFIILHFYNFSNMWTW
uniref:Uncharacterized protein n=1 Tax=Arundo donax TaxID=35708 RepID=A0A0A9B3U4_ARUDO